MDLSPEAQAVLDAANRNNSYGPDDCLNESRWIVAAALRAAAHWLAYETQLDDPMMTTTHVVNVDDLDRIAAELESLQ